MTAWIAIVCTTDDGLYKVKVNCAEDEPAAKNMAHNIVMHHFKPRGISTVIVTPLTPQLEEKMRQEMTKQAFMDFMNNSVIPST